MKYHYSLVFLLVLLLCLPHGEAKAQNNTDKLLANQYFYNKEYDKAVVYYEKALKNNFEKAVYKNYLESLLILEEYKKADKMIGRLIRQFPSDLTYYVDLGLVEEKQGSSSKKQKQFDEAIRRLSANQRQVIELARAFEEIGDTDYAIKTYLQGRKLIRGSYPFNIELASVYESKGDVGSMVREYLDLLNLNTGYIQSVQNALQETIEKYEGKPQLETVKKELLKAIQSSPGKIVYAELLIWMQLQTDDYEGAFLQTRALDKRRKEEGVRMLNLAITLHRAEEYDLSIEAYDYILSLGRRAPYYYTARMNMLNVMFDKVVQSGNYTEKDLIEIKGKFSEVLDEIGRQENTAPLLKNLAQLEAYYLHHNDTAIEILNQVISFTRLPEKERAECKLQLGDVLLLSGDIWEASLMYSQVEKAFKYDAIGQEAKYRNARISYYTGDFKWAQAQLDVLKGATSKLIANDAMHLSMTISDNLAIDTTTTPLFIFAQADLVVFQNKDEEAMELLDSLSTAYAFHALSDDVLMLRHRLALKRNKLEEAAKFLQMIIDNYSNDILADDATFKLAEIYQDRLNNTDKAMQLYQDVIVNFPGSTYVVEARKRYRKLRGDFVN